MPIILHHIKRLFFKSLVVLFTNNYNCCAFVIFFFSNNLPSNPTSSDLEISVRKDSTHSFKLDDLQSNGTNGQLIFNDILLFHEEFEFYTQGSIIEKNGSGLGQWSAWSQPLVNGTFVIGNGLSA